MFMMTSFQMKLQFVTLTLAWKNVTLSSSIQTVKLVTAKVVDEAIDPPVTRTATDADVVAA